MGNCLGSKKRKTLCKSTRLKLCCVETRTGSKSTSSPKRKVTMKDLRTIRPVVINFWVSRGMPMKRPYLSVNDKRIVQVSWIFLRDNMGPIGLNTFYMLFHYFPEFLTRTARHRCEVSRTTYKEFVRFHARLVMFELDRTIGELDDEDEFLELVRLIGERHVVVSVRPEYLDCFVPYYIDAIHPYLNSKWASVVESAWGNYLKVIIHIMKCATLF